METPTAGYIAFYIEHELCSDGEMRLRTKQKTIPLNLKKKFLEAFKDRLPYIRGSEIDNFLEDNGSGLIR